MRPVTTRTTGVVLLALLLAGFLLLGALPNQVADIRVGGLSLLWWYGGVLAPVAGGARRDPLARRAGARPVFARMTSVDAHPGRLAHPGDGAGGAGGPRRARARRPLARPRGDPGARCIALGWGTGRPAPGDELAGGETLFPVVTLLVTVGVLLWANIALAGDVAAWLGARRWQGIVITAGAGWLLTAWRPLRRTAPLLLAIAFAAAVVVLLQLAWALALGPIAAWDRVATQPAFRFPPSSPWVIGGRDLGVVRGRRAARSRRGASPHRARRGHPARPHAGRRPPRRHRVDAGARADRDAARRRRDLARLDAAAALRGRQAGPGSAGLGHGLGRRPAAPLARSHRPGRHAAGAARRRCCARASRCVSPATAWASRRAGCCSPSCGRRPGRSTR